MLPKQSPDILFLFAGAGVVLYAASRAAVDAVTRAKDPSPGRMALAQWMPIAWSALIATAAGRPDIAVSVVFASSIAALALNLGVLLILVPTPEALSPGAVARAWAFVLPAALVPLLAGFAARLNWWHALMMLVLGATVRGVWRAASPDEPPPASEASLRPIRVIQLIIAIALAGVGAWLGFQAILAADERTRFATGGLIAAAVLSPLLTLPMLGTGAVAGNHGRFGEVIANLVAIVLLNVCLLLPLVIMTHYGRQMVLAWRSGTREFLPLILQSPLPFPLGVWRIDNVLLVVLALLVMLISIGRWRLQRGDGMALTFGYIAYLLASAMVIVRL